MVRHSACVYYAFCSVLYSTGVSVSSGWVSSRSSLLLVGEDCCGCCIVGEDSCGCWGVRSGWVSSWPSLLLVGEDPCGCWWVTSWLESPAAEKEKWERRKRKTTEQHGVMIIKRRRRRNHLTTSICQKVHTIALLKTQFGTSNFSAPFHPKG